MPRQGRPNLVVVRAGEASLHRNWLQGRSTRSWDLVVSWYGRTPYEPVADETTLAVTGGKLDGLRRTFDLLPGILDRYDYVWLPDDDIDTDCATIERLFRIMRKEGLSLGQPSLSMNSYFSWVHTLNCPAFRLRYTDQVEMMAPCFSSSYLQTVLPHFPDSISGWGIDQVWARLAEDNYRKSAIIDAISVHHTRPVGTFLKPIAEQHGEDPFEDAAAVRRVFGLGETRPEATCYGGKCAVAGLMLGQDTVAKLMRWTYRARAKRNAHPGSVKRQTKAFFRQRKTAPDLSRLSPVSGEQR